MKIISPSFDIRGPIDGEVMLKRIEEAGRTCYKSEDKITEGSARKFVKMVIDRKHYSVLEHESISVRVICDRGVTHEWVRHRLGSYSQESTRFCDYSTEKFGREITVIKPWFWAEDSAKYREWKEHLQRTENVYFYLLELGATAQEARSVLPNSLKTEIVVTFNLRQWRHFFALRTAKNAHPQMREIAIPMLAAFRKLVPIIFDDVGMEDQ